MAKWLPVTEDFDKSLVIKKWRYDVSVALSGTPASYDGALSELPNIDIKTCWNNSKPENGYAFSNRFNLAANYFSSRYYNFTDGKWTATTTSHTTQVEGSIYEFECPVDLYWAGVKETNWNPAIPSKMWFYVDADSLEIDTTEIAASSGGSAYTVNVSADTEVTWTASTSDSWIGLSSPTGTGNGSFTVNIPENPEYAARSGEITVVSSDEGEATIAVSQEKKPAIFTRRDIYRSGNLVNKMYRSGELIFQRIGSETPPTPSGYSNQYLTFEILSAGTINWKSTNSGFTRTVQYSKNNGETWNSITSTTAGTQINVAAEDKLLFKGDNDAYGSLENGDCTFSGTTAKFNVEGNIMSLINSTNFSNLDILSSAHTFSSLFSYCTGLTDASNLILPATTLVPGCYDSMFRGCKSLTVGPELPATTLTNGCYSWMFTACYSLTTAPALPAETLADYCYHNMFASCSGLTQAPELPATTLGLYCYQYMFYNCKSLNYVKCLATDISATNCTYSWLNNVASAGTFVKAASMSDWTSGKNGIPTGWTVVDDGSLPAKTFVFNCNAKNYVESANTITRTTGGTLSQDMVFQKTSNTAYTDVSSAITASSNHISYHYGTYAQFSFTDSASSPFNITDTSKNMTLILKFAVNPEEYITPGTTTAQSNIIVNRDNSQNNWIARIEALETDRKGMGLSTTSINVAEPSGVTHSVEPVIVAYIVNNKQITVKNITGGLTNTPFTPSYSTAGSKRLTFFGQATQTDATNVQGCVGGDFYWAYLSREVLTDAEIQLVIDYNENL